MGRSVARFFLAGQAAAGILHAANGYGDCVGMHADSLSANHVTLVKGRQHLDHRKAGAHRRGMGRPRRANVQVEAYVEGLTELSADPKPIVGMIPRRDMWRIASAFVASLRVNPEAVFVHS